ncbi:hypothetical protein BDV18DRAFT_148072 [Aspergillus unguis]
MFSTILSFIQRFFDFSDANVPWLTSLIAILSMSRGVRCLITPKSQYYEYGVPREGASPSSNSGSNSGWNSGSTEDSTSNAAKGTVSPMIFARGIREFGFGALAGTMERNDTTLKALAMISALMSLADAVVVLVYAPRNRQMLAYHLLAAVYFGAVYYARRACYA